MSYRGVVSQSNSSVQMNHDSTAVKGTKLHRHGMPACCYLLARVVNVRPAGPAHHLQQVSDRVVVGSLAVGSIIVLGAHDDHQVGC